MADSRAQLEAYKAAASRSQAQLDTATTKDAALTHAISVADNLIKAMKLAPDPEEKKMLKSLCRNVMDAADRIKRSQQWVPPASTPMSNIQNDSVLSPAELAKSEKDPIPALKSNSSESSLPLTKNTQTERIGRWAAEVSQSAASTSHSNDSTVKAKDDSAVNSTLSPSEASANHSQTIIPPSSKATTPPTERQASGSPIGLRVDGAEMQSTQSVDQRGSTLADALAFRPRKSAVEAPQPAQDPAFAPSSKIHRLKEPISTRTRTNKEEILILRASFINGFKCPPWDKNPSSAEFALQEGAEAFKDTRDLVLSTYQQQFFKGWTRATKALPPPSMFPENTTGLGPLMSSGRSIDLVQDAATDCSVVASLCAGIARTERGHHQMLSNMVWPFDQSRGKPVISPNGKYVVRLNFNGCWRKVVIDDRLPLSSTHRLLHVIDRRNPGLLWPALLEKAYLKVRGGYDFPGSNSCSDLWTMTGWIPEEIYLQETETVLTPLWNRIYNGFTYGDVLVTVGTGKMSTRQERELGLEGQHSYVVLDMKETDHDRLLLVKNPWVEGKGWRGLRPSAAPAMDISSSSDQSNGSTEAYNRDSMPSKDRPHPTTFWIGFEQVIQHFERLYLNWNPGLFRYRQDIHFDWTVEDNEGAGGCIVQHPQFSFSAKSTGPVWFLLSRHFRDAPEDLKEESDTFNDGSIRTDAQMYSSGDALKGYMSIFICNGNGERLYIKDTYLESSPYVNTTQCLLKWDAVAESIYTIVIDQEELPPSHYTFSLSAFCNSAIVLEAAKQKYPIQKIVNGAWTKQTAGGDTSSPRYFENPQYSLEVLQPGSLAILLTSTDHENPLHVKLALGYGKRIYKLQSRDILVDSGNHRSGCVFAEIKDLQPGTYTIICSLFEPGKIGNYSMRVDSTSEVVLKSIPRDGAGLISTKLSPACFGPDMHKVAAPLVPQRLASYTIVARFLKATSPRSHELGMLARSPLRLSIELGRGPDRKFLMTSERGEYSDTAIVRSDSLDLDPALTRDADLWLVLDRLSGTGGPVEEWYDVEIFTDMPQAFAIGVWREWDD